jgi:hypothetical protein
VSFLIERYAFRGNCQTEFTGEGSSRFAIVSGPCYSCTQTQEVRAAADALNKFQAGGYAQDCFPDLSAGQREFLISGICDECWDKLFAEIAE